ncbi:hypothetical protein FRC01_012352, partial [Tulasnella sp. 417]
MDYCTLSTGVQDGGLSDEAQAAYCAMNGIPSCCGICPNQDLSGIGVRSAFYLQALMNAVLIVISPDDGAEAAWASTILTGALVIPAMIQKFQEQMTLHHATLVLNFATLSTIATVATAPMVPIWRKQDGAAEIAEAYKRASRGEKRAAEENSRRGRIVLSIVLLAQIILQWAWAVIVFVHPYYGQAPCSETTTIVFLFGAYTAEEINEKHFALWTFWLFLCLASSLAWGIIMVFSCTNPVHQIPRPSVADVPENRTLRGRMRQASMYVRVKDTNDQHAAARLLNRISNAVAGMVVLMFLVISEKQIKVNNVLPGENNLWSFSQLAALMLAVAPVWPIAISYLSKAHEKKERKRTKSINCVNAPPPIGAVNGQYPAGLNEGQMTPVGEPPTTPFFDGPITSLASPVGGPAKGYFPPPPAPVVKRRGPSASVSFAEPPNFRAPNSSSSVNVLALTNDAPAPFDAGPAASTSTAIPTSASVPTRRPPPRRQKAIPAEEPTAMFEEPPDPDDPFGLSVFGRRSPG